MSIARNVGISLTIIDGALDNIIGNLDGCSLRIRKTLHQEIQKMLHITTNISNDSDRLSIPARTLTIPTLSGARSSPGIDSPAVWDLRSGMTITSYGCIFRI